MGSGLCRAMLVMMLLAMASAVSVADLLGTSPLPLALCNESPSWSMQVFPISAAVMLGFPRGR